MHEIATPNSLFTHLYNPVHTAHDKLTPVPSLHRKEGTGVSIFETKQIFDHKDGYKG